ncbi:MAG: stage III sporulation protein AE, partial [Clostridia bacterium]
MKRLPLIILCVILLCGTLAHAEDDDIFKRQYNALELDSLTRQSPQNIEIKKDISLDSGLSALFKSLLGQIGGVFKKGLSCITIIIAIAVLTAIIKSMYNTGSKAVPVCISAVSAVAVTAAAAGSITTLIGMGQSAIEGMNVFSKSLLPTLAASITATGAPLGGAARYAATVMFSDIIITLINTVLMPLVYTYIAAATANAALEDASLSKITDFLHWIVTGSLKILIGVFVFYITVSGIIASTTDVVGAKTARFALNGAVPVVGGILSDAAGTVIAGAMAIKNA